MFSVFRQPYAVLEPPLAQVRIAALVGLFIGLFLLIFQPFGLNSWSTDYKWLKVCGFGLVSFAITAVHFTLWPTLFPRFFAEQNWTVGRAIGFMLLNILVISVGNYLYLGFLLGLSFSFYRLLWTLGITLLVGVFPTSGIILSNYIRQLRTYRNGAAGIQRTASHSDSPTHPVSLLAQQPFDLLPTQLSLVADNDKDQLTFAVADLLCIESSDNYCTIYYLQQGKLHKPLLRSSLSRLEAQLASYPRLVRCHRSFIVNLDRVERVTGNAQGYKLHLANGQFEVPVARRYNETLVAGFKEP